MVYTNESLSLATLEVLAHAENLEMLNHYVALRVDLPATSVTTLEFDTLPEDWQSEPAPESTRLLGLDWFHQQETLVLKVPSVLIPSEHNFIINPNHEAFGANNRGGACTTAFRCTTAKRHCPGFDLDDVPTGLKTWLLHQILRFYPSP